MKQSLMTQKRNRVSTDAVKLSKTVSETKTTKRATEHLTKPVKQLSAHTPVAASRQSRDEANNSNRGNTSRGKVSKQKTESGLDQATVCFVPKDMLHAFQFSDPRTKPQRKTPGALAKKTDNPSNTSNVGAPNQIQSRKVTTEEQNTNLVNNHVYREDACDQNAPSVSEDDKWLTDTTAENISDSDQTTSIISGNQVNASADSMTQCFTDQTDSNEEPLSVPVAPHDNLFHPTDQIDYLRNQLASSQLRICALERANCQLQESVLRTEKDCSNLSSSLQLAHSKNRYLKSGLAAIMMRAKDLRAQYKIVLSANQALNAKCEQLEQRNSDTLRQIGSIVAEHEFPSVTSNATVGADEKIIGTDPGKPTTIDEQHSHKHDTIPSKEISQLKDLVVKYFDENHFETKRSCNPYIIPVDIAVQTETLGTENEAELKQMEIDRLKLELEKTFQINSTYREQLSSSQTHLFKLKDEAHRLWIRNKTLTEERKVYENDSAMFVNKIRKPLESAIIELKKELSSTRVASKTAGFNSNGHKCTNDVPVSSFTQTDQQTVDSKEHSDRSNREQRSLNLSVRDMLTDFPVEKTDQLVLKQIEIRKTAVETIKNLKRKMSNLQKENRKLSTQLIKRCSTIDTTSNEQVQNYHVCSNPTNRSRKLAGLRETVLLLLSKNGVLEQNILVQLKRQSCRIPHLNTKVNILRNHNHQLMRECTMTNSRVETLRWSQHEEQEKSERELAATTRAKSHSSLISKPSVLNSNRTKSQQAKQRDWPHRNSCCFTFNTENGFEVSALVERTGRDSGINGYEAVGSDRRVLARDFWREARQFNADVAVIGLLDQVTSLRQDTGRLSEHVQAVLSHHAPQLFNTQT